MNWFSRLFSRTLQNEQFKLGRWFIHYDQKIINTKIDQANEDHCGCCEIDIEEEYYKPFLY